MKKIVKSALIAGVAVALLPAFAYAQGTTGGTAASADTAPGPPDGAGPGIADGPAVNPSVWGMPLAWMVQLEMGLKEAAKKAGVATKFYRVGTMFCTYFTDKEVVDYKTAKLADTDRFSRYFMGMLDRGIYLAPSQFEAGFISLAHSMGDIDTTVKAAFETLKRLR